MFSSIMFFFVQIALTHAKIRHVINQVGTACSDVRPDIGTIIAALHALKIAKTDTAL